MFDALFDWMDPPLQQPSFRVESSGANFTPHFRIEGHLPYHDMTISVSAYTDKSLRKKIDFDVKWFKSFHQQEYRIPDHDCNYYHCSPADVDLEIKAHLTSKQAGYSGTAILTFGPIKMSPTVRT